MYLSIYIYIYYIIYICIIVYMCKHILACLGISSWLMPFSVLPLGSDRGAPARSSRWGPIPQSSHGMNGHLSRYRNFYTGRTSFLTPGTQKLPHPHGTQGYPRQTGSYPRDQILLAHWYHATVCLANTVVKMCPCHCETHI